ncbi:MAG TPA: sigma 54-interacting transcriptional regulator [Polyangiaceae bacterium]|nr:sigma 54-interacting transcriptional regulator [Polyangiaceae bacterium]
MSSGPETRRAPPMHGGSDDLADTLDDQKDALRARAASLEVTAGPDAGLRARLDRPVIVVGSGPVADVRLADDTVSRVHLRLSLTQDGVHVRDESSKNGTWLGGVRIESVVLAQDALLQLGASSLAVRIDAEHSSIELHPGDRFGESIGVSEAIRHVHATLARAAHSEAAVLLEGEPGVGKDALARAVHAASPRKDGPLVSVDCAGFSPTLLEDELFGHEPGAFEGTGEERAGAFELAHGGTLVLEEVSALTPDLQAKLKDAIDALATRRIGGESARPFDVRIVATSQRPVADLVAADVVRQDLYDRLSVARVAVPPLRDRPGDVLPIATHFLREAAQDPVAELSAELAGMLVAYRWPGNVRELRNVILRYATLGARDRNALFGTGAFGDRPGLPSLEELGELDYHDARQKILERFEDAYIPAVLERAGGVVAKAAELAGVARPSFYRMVDRQRARKK